MQQGGWGGISRQAGRVGAKQASRSVWEQQAGSVAVQKEPAGRLDGGCSQFGGADGLAGRGAGEQRQWVGKPAGRN